MSYSTERYRKFRDAGLCPYCGGERDDPDKIFCTSCRQKLKQSDKADYYWYKENGICPVCRKNNLFGGEHACLECKAKKNIYMIHYRARNREEYNAKQLEINKQTYRRLREEGLCVECKRKVDDPEKHARCEWCRAKYRERRARERIVKMAKPSLQQIRKEAGLCYLCGEPLYEKHKVCKKHYENLMERRGGGKGFVKREQANRSTVSKV